MQLEIRHLKLVAAIAETGSVTLAGNRLHLTQSALSHQLRDAEEQLGVALFERRDRRMALTAAGERLLQSARTVLEELARAEKEIQECNGNGPAKGVLRLSTECYTVYHWLPPRLRLFQHKFPAVDFQLVIEATDNPFEALLEGKLDLAIVHACVAQAFFCLATLCAIVTSRWWLTAPDFSRSEDAASVDFTAASETFCSAACSVDRVLPARSRMDKLPVISPPRSAARMFLSSAFPLAMEYCAARLRMSPVKLGVRSVRAPLESCPLRTTALIAGFASALRARWAAICCSSWAITWSYWSSRPAM